LRTSVSNFLCGLIMAVLGRCGIESTTHIWPLIFIVIGVYSMAAAVLDGWLNP